MAVHDLHYASPPDDWPTLTHRLQLLAELKVGTQARAVQASEDAAFELAARQV